eukprot:8555285-Alexandrium_andersonii.AAC.1
MPLSASADGLRSSPEGSASARRAPTGAQRAPPAIAASLQRFVCATSLGGGPPPLADPPESRLRRAPEA